jgi:tetratricopeptide (TPR) repeat protein
VILAALLVAAAVTATHWPVLGARALAVDDNVFVTQNPLVTRPGWESARRFWTEVLNPSSISAYYLPLSMTSLMVDYALGGRPSDPRVFHRTNLLLHALASVLLLLLLHRLFGSLVPAVIVALAFGLHPLSVEPVASIGERKTLLAACFGFGCLSSYVEHVRRASRAWLAASLALFALALLSKPSVTAMPILLLLLDGWPLGRLSWSRVVEKWPFALLSLGFTAITILSVVRTWPFGAPPPIHPARMALQVCYLLGFYLSKIAWPADLSTVYPPPDAFTLSDPFVLLGLAAVCGLGAGSLLAPRRIPAPIAGGALFVAALAPTFGILRWSWIIAYDRYVYFPAVGIALALGAGLAAAWGPREGRRPFPRPAALALALIVLAAEARGTRAVIAHWADSVTLWRHVVRVASRAPEAHNGLGAALEASLAHEEAAREFRRAVELEPGFGDAQLNLGAVLIRLGRAAEAIPHLRLASRLEPGEPRAYYQLGLAEQRLGRLEQAAAQFRRALLLRPGFVEALDRLGTVLVETGREPEGLELVRRAIELAPENAHPHFSLAMLLLRLGGREAEAASHLDRAVRAEPDWTDALNELAWLRATSPDPALRNPAEAMRLAERAARGTGRADPSVLDTQAAAQAAAGRFREAAGTARVALELARRAGRVSLAAGIRDRLALYERGIAYRQASAPIARGPGLR